MQAEFGIVEQIDPEKDYSKYEPEKYDCVDIDDDFYISDWWDQLNQMKTYFGCLSNSSMALSRWGVTLIPPDSLLKFLKIVINDKRIKTDENLKILADKIRQAIRDNKYMIHYGI